MRTSTRVGLVLGVVGEGADTAVVSGDSVVGVVPDSVLGAVVPGAWLVIVDELSVVASGGTVLVAVSSPFPHAGATASNPSTRPTRRMRTTSPFSLLFTVAPSALPCQGPTSGTTRRHRQARFEPGAIQTDAGPTR